MKQETKSAERCEEATGKAKNENNGWKGGMVKKEKRMTKGRIKVENKMIEEDRRKEKVVEKGESEHP